MSERAKSTAGNLAVQGGILAAASLIVRLIGFFYRIPLVRILGTEGMGYYSSAFTVYSYLLVLSSYRTALITNPSSQRLCTKV